MELIARRWNGYVHGTNTGKLALELSDQGKNPKGILRFMDDSFGLVVYSIEGTSSTEGITFIGKPAENLGGDNITYDDITIDCKLTSEGNLRGHWSSKAGTGGTFVAYPFNEVSSGITEDSALPEQIFTKRMQLGFVQLYKDDVINVAEFIKKEFTVGQIVVTYQSKEKPERINYLSDFVNTNDVTSLTYLKLYISEPEGRGINRSIAIELRAYGVNELMVQGMTESWVLGKTQMTASYLKRYEDNVRNIVNKFFPAAQLILLLSMIVWITTMVSLKEKILLCIGTFIAIHAAPRIFIQLFPNAIIKIGEEKSGFFRRVFQKGGNWIIGFGIVVLTLLTERYAERVADSIQAFVTTLFLSNTP